MSYRAPSSGQAGLSRRHLFGSGLALASVIGLAACSTGQRGGDDASSGGATASSSPQDSFPVTVEHALGTTTVEKAPQRVVTVGGSNNQDFVAALGVVPVAAVKVAWGGNDKGSTDWFDRKVSELGGDAPQFYDESDGTNFTAVAEATPDLIVAVNSGITKEDYERLGKIAPVIAYPTAPWINAWQDQQRLVAKALGRSQAGEDLVKDTEDLVEQRSEELGDAAGKSFIYGDVMQKLGFYGPGDARPRFFEALGLTLAPVVTRNIAKDQFWREWPEERADELDSDLFLSYVQDQKTEDRFTSDPMLKEIPAVKAGHGVFTQDMTAVTATSSPSPLAMPHALDAYVPALRDVMGKPSS